MSESLETLLLKHERPVTYLFDFWKKHEDPSHKNAISDEREMKAAFYSGFSAALAAFDIIHSLSDLNKDRLMRKINDDIERTKLEYD